MVNILSFHYGFKFNSVPPQDNIKRLNIPQDWSLEKTLMSHAITFGKSLKILVPKEWSNDDKGHFLEQLASKILMRQSYEIISRIRFTGMEIDLLATHKPSNDNVYIECKFHSRPISANVIDLIVGQAFRRRINKAALFSIGQLGKEAKGAIEEIKNDERISFSYYSSEVILDTMIDTSTSSLPPDVLIPTNISHAHLIVHPEFPFVWILQEQKDGRPTRLIPYIPSGPIPLPLPKDLRNLLDNFELLEGLPVVDYLDTDSEKKQTNNKPYNFVEPIVEHVSRIVTADTLIDYRPCKPDNFVGRSVDQKDIWDFFEEVRKGLTETRLISLVGASGYGKSSLIAKLSERFMNRKWKNKIFLYPVDVRSARGPQFISEALLQGIRSAHSSDFIKIPSDISITNAENILSSPSIQSILKSLKNNKRVLVIFFDQFEEVFTKDELLPVFRLFKRFALDVNAEKSNLIIGFSWRTGISLSDENPAYQLWHELSDYRITKRLLKFDSGESSRLITQFEDAIGNKLIQPLRRRLLEQGQGLPWLLKKICIHVYKQIKKGESQIELLGSRLNVKGLFDEDLEPLSEAQLSCLKYIAKNSPADSIEIYDRYNSDVVNFLVNSRIIVRTGQRFSVYWDIFRDYLNEGTVPAIPWTYIPNSSLKMTVSASNALVVQKGMTSKELATLLGYSQSTTNNIVMDLQNIALCKSRKDSVLEIEEHVNQDTLSKRIRAQFLDHIVYRNFISAAHETNSLTKDMGIQIVRSLYPGANLKQKTRDNYLTRLLPWFEYAGLIKQSSNEIYIFPPQTIGPDFGKINLYRRRSKKPIFLGSATPESTVKLLESLIKRREISRDELFRNGQRNASQDLSSLGLAIWKTNGLVLNLKLMDITDATILLSQAALESESVKILIDLETKNPNMKKYDIGKKLAIELGRNWKQSSIIRYTNGLFRYINYSKEQIANK